MYLEQAPSTGSRAASHPRSFTHFPSPSRYTRRVAVPMTLYHMRPRPVQDRSFVQFGACVMKLNVLMQPLFAHLVRDEAQEDGGGDKGGTDYNLIQPMNQMRSRAAGQRQSGPCSSCIMLSYRKSQLIAFLPRQAPASSSEGGNSTRESIHVFFK